MLKIKFFVLKLRKTAITGGHRYDMMLFDVIKKIPGINLKAVEVGAPNTPKIFKPFIEFVRSLKNSKCDIIVFNSASCLRLLPAMLFLRIFTRKKLYTTHHLFIYEDFKGFKRFIYKNAETIFLKCARKIIVPSPYIYDELKKMKTEKDLLLWRIPFDSKREFPMNPLKGNLTFIGNIEQRKGLIYMFEALNLLQKKDIGYKLKILGKVIDENYFKQLNEYSENHNLNVEFLGFTDTLKRNKILSETDIFIFPSLIEGYGMVLVEALIYGLPIVCFDNTSMPYTVKNNVNGFLVKDKNFHEMADKISKLITDRPLRNKFSQGALESLKEHWDFNKFETAVDFYFKSLISQSS